MLAVRRHGEAAGIVSLLTRDHGRHLGLARGAFGKRLSGVLQPGNAVSCTWSGRLAENLGTFRIELGRALLAPLLDDPNRLAALSAATALVELALPEREPHPSLYDGLTALLLALDDGAETWPAVYVRFELGLLAELGFGLDLTECAATGARQDLTHVSPRSGRAVSAGAAVPYAGRLLRLPSFLTGGAGGPPANDPAHDIADGLALTGFFLEQRVLGPQGQGLPPARTRLVDRLVGKSATSGVDSAP